MSESLIIQKKTEKGLVQYIGTRDSDDTDYLWIDESDKDEIDILEHIESSDLMDDYYSGGHWTSIKIEINKLKQLGWDIIETGFGG